MANNNLCINDNYDNKLFTRDIAQAQKIADYFYLVIYTILYHDLLIPHTQFFNAWQCVIQNT